MGICLRHKVCGKNFAEIKGKKAGSKKLNFSLPTQKIVKPLLLLVILIFNSPSFSQTTKLNSALQINGDIIQSKVSSDGRYVVYLADQDADNRNELYSVPIDRSRDPVKLNGSLVTGGEVGDFYNGIHFEISADSQTVFYVADENRLHTHELFSVDMNGGNNRRLSEILVDGTRSVESFLVDNFSKKVIYTDAELYSVNFDGTSRTKLTGGLSSGGTVGLYRISEEDARVFFIARGIDSLNIAELYSNNFSGTDLRKLNSSMVTNGNVLGFLVTKNLRVVYAADQVSNGVTELFVTGIRGGTVSRISDTSSINSEPGKALQDAILNSPNELRVLFSVGTSLGGVEKLYSSHTNGNGTNYDLSPSPSEFSFNSNGIKSINVDNKYGTQITYTLENQLTSDVYITDDIGLSIRKISNATGVSRAYASKFTPDGDSILLLTTDSGPECSISASTRHRLIKYNHITEQVTVVFLRCSGGGIQNDYVFSNHSNHVVFVYNGSLFAANLSGGETRQITPFEAGSGRDVAAFGITSDDKYIWYAADQDVDNQLEMYSTPLKEEPNNNQSEICVPVKAKNSKLALICL